jgi:endonuclease-8
VPEGPSIFIAKEVIHPLLKGQEVISAIGNAKEDLERLEGLKIRDVRSWGKQLLILFPGFIVRIHFLMFGTYSVDKQTRQKSSLRLCIVTPETKIFFYTCSVKFLEGKPEELYDAETDLLNKKWNAAKARKKLKAKPGLMACDAILDQEIFAGAGNIFKNEVLYRIRVHPETRIKDLPPRKLTELVNEVHNYAYDFLKWKRKFVLKKHWLAHTKRTCVRCEIPLVNKYCGKTKRRTFFCKNCQVKY